MIRLRQAILGYPELVMVLAAAAIGLSVQSPLAWLTSHQGINALLVVLVFSTSITIEPSALRRSVCTGSGCLRREVFEVPSRGVEGIEEFKVCLFTTCSHGSSEGSVIR